MYASSRKKQTGNVALMTTMLTMLFCCTGVLALDVGRVYFERENLKKLSETVALDVVANSDIFNGESVGDISSMALASIERNGFDPQADGFSVTARRISLDTDENGAWRIPEDGNAAADHVLVEISKEIPSSLFFDLQKFLEDDNVSDTLTVNVSSVARRSVFAAFSTESRLLAVDTNESALLEPLLKGMLGSEVDIKAISSSGLLNQSIQIGELIEALVSVDAVNNIDSVPTLLAMEVTAAQLFEALLETREDTEQRKALSSMVKNAAENITGEVFTIGDILLVETAEIPLVYIEALPLRLDSLIEAAVLTVTDKISTTIESLDLPVLIESMSLDLEVITPPAIAIGPPGCAHVGNPCEEWRTKGRSTQIKLSLESSLDLLSIANADVQLAVTGGQGEAWLIDVSRPEEGVYHEVNFGVSSQLIGYEIPKLDMNLLSLGEVQETLNITENLCKGIRGIGLLDVLLGWLFEENCAPPSLLTLIISGEDELGGSVYTQQGNRQLSWPDGTTLEDDQFQLSPLLTSSLNDSLNQVNVSLCSDLPGIDLLVDRISDVNAEGLDVGTDLLGLQNSLQALLKSRVVDELFNSLLTPVLEALGVSLNEVIVQIHGMSASPAEVVI